MEVWNRIKSVKKGLISRIPVKELGISSTLAISSGFILPTVQTALTLSVHELLKDNRLSIGVAAFGIIALASNLASLYIESKSLKTKRYSNSPVTTGAFLLTEKPVLISTLSHLYHLAILGLMNPVNILTFINILKGQQANRLIIENALSIATINAIWNILTNGLILKGKADEITESINKAGKKITSRAKKITKNIGEIFR